MLGFGTRDCMTLVRWVSAGVIALRYALGSGIVNARPYALGYGIVHVRPCALGSGIVHVRPYTLGSGIPCRNDGRTDGRTDGEVVRVRRLPPSPRQGLPGPSVHGRAGRLFQPIRVPRCMNLASMVS